MLLFARLFDVRIPSIAQGDLHMREAVLYLT